MEPRIKNLGVSPKGLHAMLAFQKFVNECGIEHSLLELVKLRASYMNGCAYCVDMHTKDMRVAGETEQRIFAVPVWRETPFFTPRERAALAWTESVTAVAQTGIPDEAFEAARAEFSEEELVNLTWAISAINVWNRMAIGFRQEPGTYVPAGVAKSA